MVPEAGFGESLTVVTEQTDIQDGWLVFLIYIFEAISIQLSTGARSAFAGCFLVG